MSTDTATLDHEAEDAHGDDHGAHLTFSGAVKVAIFLAVVTGLETLTYFVDFGAVANPAIVIMMIVKFAVVVAYFMHLKFDNKMFTLLFMIGIVMALAVYIATLLSLDLIV